MSQGVIKKLVFDKGFGFIAAERGDIFFHCSSVADVQFDELQEGQSVEYELDEQQRRGSKGPRAIEVRPA